MLEQLPQSSANNSQFPDLSFLGVGHLSTNQVVQPMMYLLALDSWAGGILQNSSEGNTPPRAAAQQTIAGVYSALPPVRLINKTTVTAAPPRRNPHSQNPITGEEYAGWLEPTPPAAVAETPNDERNWFKFTAPTTGMAAVLLRHNGMSPFLGRLTVLDADAHELGSITNDDPQRDSPLLLSVPLVCGASYYLSIEQAPGSIFHLNPDQLQIVPCGTSLPTGYSNALDSVDSTIFANAEVLKPSINNFDYTALGLLETPQHIDYFRFTVPLGITNELLTVGTAAFGGTCAAPVVELYDAGLTQMQAKVIANDKETYALQTQQYWVVGATYYLKVRCAPNSVAGEYGLGVDFERNHQADKNVFGRQNSFEIVIPAE